MAYICMIYIHQITERCIHQGNVGTVTNTPCHFKASTYGSHSLITPQGGRSFWEQEFFLHWLKKPPPTFLSVMVQGLRALHPALKGAHSHLHGARREGGP